MSSPREEMETYLENKNNYTLKEQWKILCEMENKLKEAVFDYDLT